MKNCPSYRSVRSTVVVHLIEGFLLEIPLSSAGTHKSVSGTDVSFLWDVRPRGCTVYAKLF